MGVIVPKNASVLLPVRFRDAASELVVERGHSPFAASMHCILQPLFATLSLYSSDEKAWNEIVSVWKKVDWTMASKRAENNLSLSCCVCFRLIVEKT